jgi:hypothetical protein
VLEQGGCCLEYESYANSSAWTYTGEASFAPVYNLRVAWEPVAADLQFAVVPKAGHWLVGNHRYQYTFLLTNIKQGDENPAWSANKAIEFFGNGTNIPSIDLAWLEDTYTMFGDFGSNKITPGTNDTTA